MVALLSQGFYLRDRGSKNQMQAGQYFKMSCLQNRVRASRSRVIVTAAAGLFIEDSCCPLQIKILLF